nr:MAG TPA: hypothetical protein [Caudoviricetes sp.]
MASTTAMRHNRVCAADKGVTANRIRTSIPQHLRPMGFVPRVRNMTLDEAFIDRDFDRYEDEIIQEYRRRSDEN